MSTFACNVIHLANYKEDIIIIIIIILLSF